MSESRPQQEEPPEAANKVVGQVGPLPIPCFRWFVGSHTAFALSQQLQPSKRSPAALWEAIADLFTQMPFTLQWLQVSPLSPLSPEVLDRNKVVLRFDPFP